LFSLVDVCSAIGLQALCVFLLHQSRSGKKKERGEGREKKKRRKEKKK
jgi:hypothetical protein